ncbi:MAG: Uma2 family endonuclease [Gemmatimonadota bacterium]
MHRSVDEQLLTLEEYQALPDDGRYIDEVSRGRLVREPRPAYRHGRIVMRIGQLLLNYVDAHPGAGRVVAESGFVLEDVPLTLRGPDVAFIRADRAEPAKGFFRGAPDIAIEVVSPSNTAAELQEKVLEFLDAGTSLVWVVYPDTRTVVEHRSASDISLLRASDGLTTPLLPGFQIPVSALFE